MILAHGDLIFGHDGIFVVALAFGAVVSWIIRWFS